MSDFATAQRLFEALKSGGFGEPGVVTFYLAQIAEETKRYDDAIALYREVTEGDRAWTGEAAHRGHDGQKGRSHGRAALSRDAQARRRASSGSSARRPKRSCCATPATTRVRMRCSRPRSSRIPMSADLLYDIAMVAEKLDRLDEVEKRLNQLIALKPDNAQALNALGYTLVDRTQRTAEGLKLIEQALALAPADPFILDSMGWAQYRLGNLDDSEKFLRRALADRSDPEIAAHLGEVLWAKGERARAQEIWQSQLKQTPDNALLLETVRRFAPVAHVRSADAIARRPRGPRRELRSARSRLSACAGVVANHASCALASYFAPRSRSFEAAGRLSVRHGSDALTANFRWQHDGERDEIDLASPLGQTIARLSGDGAVSRCAPPTDAWRPRPTGRR